MNNTEANVRIEIHNANTTSSFKLLLIVKYMTVNNPHSIVRHSCIKINMPLKLFFVYENNFLSKFLFGL